MFADNHSVVDLFDKKSKLPFSLAWRTWFRICRFLLTRRLCIFQVQLRLSRLFRTFLLIPWELKGSTYWCSEYSKSSLVRSAVPFVSFKTSDRNPRSPLDGMWKISLVLSGGNLLVLFFGYFYAVNVGSPSEIHLFNNCVRIWGVNFNWDFFDWFKKFFCFRVYFKYNLRGGDWHFIAFSSHFFYD